MKSEQFCELGKADRRAVLLKGSEAAVEALQAAFPDWSLRVEVFDLAHGLGIVLHVPSGME